MAALKYLLDTNVLSEPVRAQPGQVLRQVRLAHLQQPLQRPDEGGAIVGGEWLCA